MESGSTHVNAQAVNKVHNASVPKNARCELYCSLFLQRRSKIPKHCGPKVGVTGASASVFALKPDRRERKF
jgi:hypothetical protein